MKIKLKNIDKHNQKILSQCLKKEKTKTTLANFPIILRDTPSDLDAEILEQCWNFFKSQTNILKLTHNKPTHRAKKIMSEGTSNPINNFYVNNLCAIFEIFLKIIKLFKTNIDKRTSITMRFTLTKYNSEQFIVTILPKGKWWVLKVPTQKQKMDAWITTLIKKGITGPSCMVEIYSVVH